MYNKQEKEFQDLKETELILSNGDNNEVTGVYNRLDVSHKDFTKAKGSTIMMNVSVKGTGKFIFGMENVKTEMFNVDSNTFKNFSIQVKMPVDYKDLQKENILRGFIIYVQPYSDLIVKDVSFKIVDKNK